MFKKLLFFAMTTLVAASSALASGADGSVSFPVDGPAPPLGAVQYYDVGGLHGGSSNLYWDAATNSLRINQYTNPVVFGGASFPTVTAAPPFVVRHPGAGVSPSIHIERYSPDALSTGPEVVGIRFRGTTTSPLAVESNDVIFNVAGGAYDSEYVESAGRVAIFATHDWETNSHGSRIIFFTRDTNDIFTQDRMVINHNGNVSIGDTILNPVERLIVDGNIAPKFDDVNSLGTPALRWADLHLASFIYTGDDLHIVDVSTNDLLVVHTNGQATLTTVGTETNHLIDKAYVDDRILPCEEEETSTVGATSSQFLNYTMAPNSSAYFEAFIAANNSTSSDGAGYKVRGAFRREGSGVPTPIAVPEVLPFEDIAALNVGVGTDGVDGFEFNVVGVAGETFNWVGCRQVIVSPSGL